MSMVALLSSSTCGGLEFCKVVIFVSGHDFLVSRGFCWGTCGRMSGLMYFDITLHSGLYLKASLYTQGRHSVLSWHHWGVSRIPPPQRASEGLSFSAISIDRRVK